ncbi:unnamed protein product [Protopolystoma xenopodis]|uniref:Uncharacterized protein n=1 Tax=Protopolystoma xenopodis TaxID=117903 RepID=A0A448XSH4_9PLAT|nr:unnamed protein product [Protopolystoma xenopodis]
MVLPTKKVMPTAVKTMQMIVPLRMVGLWAISSLVLPFLGLTTTEDRSCQALQLRLILVQVFRCLIIAPSHSLLGRITLWAIRLLLIRLLPYQWPQQRITLGLQLVQIAWHIIPFTQLPEDWPISLLQRKARTKTRALDPNFI